MERLGTQGVHAGFAGARDAAPAGFGWIMVALVTLLVGLAPELVRLPQPVGAFVFERATLIFGDRPATQVSLPHVIYPASGNPTSVRYVIDLESGSLTAQGLAVYIPLVNRRVRLELDGRSFHDSSANILWMGPALSEPILARLPQSSANNAAHRLAVVVEIGDYATPAYLSSVYVGPEGGFAQAYKWRHFVDVDVKVMSLAVQSLLGTGLVLAWFLRPRTTLLTWLALYQAVSVVAIITMFLGYQPVMRSVIPYVVALMPAWGMLAVGVALAFIGVRPPRALAVGIVVATAALAICASFPPIGRMIGAVTAVITLCLGALAGTSILAWGAIVRGKIDARYLLAPAVLLTWFLIRDGYVTMNLSDHAFRLYSPHVALVYVAGLVVVLGRRLAFSYDQLDRSNEVLNARLAQREAELAALAEQEKREAAGLVREQERGRLTRDLHDGISGHLVSIIAMAERAETSPIEQAARDALNDLRLVIYSLDLGEGDLPLALANFRERLEPQLQRLGVALDWSMADLADVSGVTPGNALAVLRIAQEAITNALKHGPARRITVRGSAAADGRASISIENDGCPFVAGSGGRGLHNMRRRAERLGATVTFEPLDHGTRVVVLLPQRLPDLGG